MTKLSLSSVTLVTVDTVCHALTEMALAETMRHAEFSEVIVLSDKKLNVPGALQRPYQASSRDDVARAYWSVLPWLVATEFMLIVHWDSWIIHPERWQDEFLSSDYIGAPWWYTDGHNVGNSGFNIRSTKLARHIALSGLRCSCPDDDAICRHYRSELESDGFTWATQELAWRFAFERTSLYPTDQVFGFHGIFNWPLVLSNEAIEERMAKAPEYVFKSEEYQQMRQIMTSKQKSFDFERSS